MPVDRFAARFGRGWRGFVVPAGLLVIWAGAAQAGLINGRSFVSPTAVILAAKQFIESGDAAAALAMSLVRFVAGWMIGSVAGLALGLTMGLSQTGNSLIAGSFNAIRQIALFAWIPLLTAWFGQGDWARIAFIVLATMFPVALNTQAGCRTVPIRYREVARMLEFGAARTIRGVILPAAAPAILSGLQLGLMAAWVATIGAEYLIENGIGLGVTISAARQLNDLATVIVGIVLLGICGLLLDWAAGRFVRRLIGLTNA